MLRIAAIAGLLVATGCTRGGDPLFVMDPPEEPRGGVEDAGMMTDTGQGAGRLDPIFDSVVLPIMEAANCTQCHADGAAAQSGLSVMSLDALMAGGSKAGPAIVPCDSSASPLTLVLRGELSGVLPMPLSGAITEEQIVTLEEWIDSGADLTACGEPLPEVDAGSAPDDGGAVIEDAAGTEDMTGPEETSEADDTGPEEDVIGSEITFDDVIFPLFEANNCTGCHSDAAKSSGLSVMTADALLVGGDIAGPAIIPCDGEGSPLIGSLRGSLTDIGIPLMPKFGSSMDEGDIATIVAWIDEGAGVESCDGGDEPDVTESDPTGDAMDDTSVEDDVLEEDVGPDEDTTGDEDAAGDEDTASDEPADDEGYTFTADITPIFINYGCVGCHGGSSGFNAESIDAVIAGGNIAGVAVIPCDSEASPLIQIIDGTHGSVAQMPMYGTPMDSADRDIIADWIDQGAETEVCD